MLNFPSVKDNLRDYIDARFPILYIYTYEEAKADEYIFRVAGKKSIFEWNGAKGFINLTQNKFCREWLLEGTLENLLEENDLNRSLLVIKDADEQLKSDKVAALLKEIARKIRKGDVDTTVVIISPILQIPKTLEKLITILELDLPDEEDISHIVDDFVKKEGLNVYSGVKKEMSTAFKGLTESEIEDLLRLAISREGDVTRKTLQLILDQKKQVILKAGILEMIPLKEDITDIGGLETLKDWLQKKAIVFRDINKALDFGVTVPKGVLIAGVPGCGKSLSAKAAGKLFDVPLLRLDMGRLMGKYVGESEENMRKAIRLAEAISPCVLWVDELEKAFAGIGSGGSGAEVTTRLFGMFLTWMQEKTSATFVVATANDIDRLPPELMRKGRFDEVFYVPLPNEDERRKIFEIHLNRRRRKDLNKIDIDKLVSQTEGYSGADIEGVVGESVESAYVNGNDELTTRDILCCIRDTPPLAEIMRKRLEDLSKFYEDAKIKKA